MTLERGKAKLNSALEIWDGEQYTGADLEDIYTLLSQAREALQEAETYNGWSNRETWATALHIDSDESLQNEASEKIAQAFLEGIDIDEEDGYLSGVREAEDALSDWVDDLMSDEYWDGHTPRGISLMRSDVGSLWRVNFREIAESWLEDEIQKFKAGGYKEEAGE
jgi:hypothetical protein